MSGTGSITIPDYSYWRDALAGRKPAMYVDHPELGFFRKGVYKKEDGKRAKRIGWTTVAIYLAGNKQLTAQVGPARDDNDRCTILTDRDAINDLWSYCAGHPISEEWWRAVAERGEPWPDSHEADAKAPIVPPEVAQVLTDAAEPSSEEKIAAGIKIAIEALPKYRAIDSDEMASRARSLQNKLLDSRSAAEKAYNAANRPLLDAQKALREIWFPLRDAADAGIKELRGSMEAWEDTKREAARRAQREAEEAARKHAEEVRKAEAANKPAPEPPPEIKPNTPPPAAQIRGGAGRAASVSVQKFVTSVDVMKVCAQFQTNPDVIDLMTKLAEKAIRAGLDVPGAQWEERSVVR